MDLIEEFRGLYGDDRCDEVINYVIGNNLTDEFFDAYLDLDELFKFSVHYGLLDVVKFLYIHKNLPYNLSTIQEYNSKIESSSQEGSNLAAPVMAGGANSGLRISRWDKHSQGRNECIRFLMDMKKYSKYIYRNKKHIYMFNVKYYHKFTRI